jgi:predicted hydrocarbon binding protein
MALTKGVGFDNARSFVCERFGVPGWDRLLEAMSAPDRDTLASVISVGWYELALYARLIRTLDHVHGKDDLALITDLGRYEAEHDLTTVHRLFFRCANPAYVIEKSAEYWKRFHDTGTWIITREAGARLTGTLEGWGVVDAALCHEVGAYIGRLLELVGAKEVILVHPRCRGRGDEVCTFTTTWRS